jgi:uncharacterized protein (DUF305 family)
MKGMNMQVHKMNGRRWLIAGSVTAALTVTAGTAAFAATDADHGPTAASTGGTSSGMSSMMGRADGNAHTTGSMRGINMDGGSMGSGSMGSGSMGSFDSKRPFDVQFLDQMIAHHDMALVSTHTMIDSSQDPRLRALAQEIEKSQSQQVTQMRTWRQQWYPDISTPLAGGMDPTSAAPQMMRSMMGADPARSMRSMMGGNTVDRMYLQMMIAHHQLAVSMAQQALGRGTHPQLRGLANTIIADQTAQIGQMRTFLPHP